MPSQIALTFFQLFSLLYKPLMQLLHTRAFLLLPL
jgi:hypothetical protein